MEFADDGHVGGFFGVLYRGDPGVLSGPPVEPAPGEVFHGVDGVFVSGEGHDAGEAAAVGAGQDEAQHQHEAHHEFARDLHWDFLWRQRLLQHRFHYYFGSNPDEIGVGSFSLGWISGNVSVWTTRTHLVLT